MTRRDLLLAAASGLVSAAPLGHGGISVEGYIFEQYAERRHKTLQEVVGDVLPMAAHAGFKKIELNPAFFAPELRAYVLSLIRAQGLAMPSVYVGGPMHERGGADNTIATALEIGGVCAPFGCKAIVNNPDPKPGDVSKTDAELTIQADALNRMGRTLAEHGLDLRVHHHTPQLVDNAREWRHILRNTDPEYVHICVDVDWAYEAGFAPLPFLKEVGGRLRELHVRSARNKVWLEDLENSDIDYAEVSQYLRENSLDPLIVVELAYRTNTVVTRPLEEDLRLSRIYAERIFGVHA